ncbi:MAG: type I restriction enzyme HsdR N-terminal domain-containing protein [Candidatus Cyclobacteriaceae bacterium M3_2C_046]
METLNLPACQINLKKSSGKVEYFDIIRKKYLQLTPEEWVRQHFVHYLINYLNYPKSLIRLEGGLKYNQISKRSDILVYSRQGKPYLIVECKAPQVKITQDTFWQAATYNQVHQAQYLATTNGLVHYCCEINAVTGKVTFLNEMPAFK